MTEADPICAVCDRQFSDHKTVISHDFAHQKVPPPSKEPTGQERAVAEAEWDDYRAMNHPRVKLEIENFNEVRAFLVAEQGRIARENARLRVEQQAMFAECHRLKDRRDAYYAALERIANEQVTWGMGEAFQKIARQVLAPESGGKL